MISTPHDYTNHTLKEVMEEYRKRFPSEKVVSRKEMIEAICTKDNEINYPVHNPSSPPRYIYIMLDSSTLTKEQMLIELDKIRQNIENSTNPMEIPDSECVHKSKYILGLPTGPIA